MRWGRLYGEIWGLTSKKMNAGGINNKVRGYCGVEELALFLWFVPKLFELGNT